jgi:hypothetical protein
MARISAKKTRQALVGTGVELHPGFPPDTIELFDGEGNPLDLYRVDIPVGGFTGQILTKVSDTDYDVAWIDPPIPPPSGMVWKGTWDPGTTYVINDVVQYDDGSGAHTYIFIEDVPATPPVTPDDPLPNFDGDPVTQYWDSAITPMPVILDATSPTSDIVYNAGAPYTAVAFKKTGGGLIEIRTAPQDGLFRDLIANFYRLSGTSWVFATQNNDSSGLGHPRIQTSQSNNKFLFVLTTTDGADPTTQYGTSLITLGSNNLAVFEPFVFAAGPPEFPVDSVIQIG